MGQFSVATLVALFKMQAVTATSIVCALSLLQSRAPSFPVNEGLNAELAKWSYSEGLGIITTAPSSGTLPVNYFDHQSDQINCCGRTSNTWVIMGGRRLLAVDFTAPVLSHKRPASLGVIESPLWANAVLFGLDGAEQRRYKIPTRASFVAVSADGKAVAFTGPVSATGSDSPKLPGGRTSRAESLLFGFLDSARFTQIYSSQDRDYLTGERPHTIAWSADGREIVYGKDGTIFLYNLREAASRPLAKGANPLWSPDGLWISYRGPRGEAMLIDASEHRQRQILQGQKIQHALHWSPDGRYLMLTLLNEGGSVAWASLAVYRLSDGAVTAVGEPGLTSLDDWGMDWVLMGPRR